MRARPKGDNPNSRKNLIPITHETASAMGKKGGPAAAAARKRNKTRAEIVQKIARNPIKDPKQRKEIADKLGLAEDDELVNDTLITAGIFGKAMEGDVKAVEKWEEWSAAGGDDSGKFELPARVLGKAFVDINREIEPNKKYIFKGGRGSTKSSYISLKLIELLKNNPAIHACVIRKVAATLRDSVYAQVKWAIHELGLDDEFKCKVSPMEITYLKTGQTIFFRGLDDPIKLKSIKPPFGYIGIIWKEEKDQLDGPEEERNVNQSVLRGGDITYDFSSYNPPKTMNAWVNQELLTIDDRRVVHESSYLDVPRAWLGSAFIDEAEHLKIVNPSAYEHEYLGVANGNGGNVFEYLECRKITNAEIKRMDRLYFGVDWGFYPDPYAFTVSYYDPAHETIYILDEYYVNKKRNKDTAKWILDHYGKLLPAAAFGVVCDSSEEKSIADYQDLGITNAIGAYKPPGSVEYGMKWLQGKKIVIDQRRTPNAHREFTKYEYPRNKNGDVISGYIDADNHTIDSVRYALSPLFMRRFSHA